MTDILGSLSPEKLVHFWSRSQFNPANGCLEWTRAVNTDGYPLVWLCDALHSVHKLVHIHYSGPLSAGQIAAHGCGNRRCILPAHLIAQTRSEKTADRLAWGRKGVIGPRLTVAEEAEIAALYGIGKGLSQQMLARVYDVSRQTILRVVRQTEARRVAEAAQAEGVEAGQAAWLIASLTEGLSP